MNCKCAAALALCLTVYLPFAASAQNLVTNGSFELPGGAGAVVHSGNIGGGFQNNDYITDWTVYTGNIDYLNGWESSDGSWSLDLVGFDSQGAGGIRQTIATVPGETYIVTFDMAANPSGSTVKTLRVSAAGSDALFTFDRTGKTTANMGWEEKTWSFVATSTSTVLSFEAVGLDGFSAGPALDNVYVEQQASLFFLEAFNGPGVGPNLEDPDGAYVVSGGVIRKLSSSGNEDRHYVRTVRTDYRSNDWTYTISFDTRGTGFEIVFIGVGAGERNPSFNNEPGNAAFFRIHSKSTVSGRIDVGVMRTGQSGFDFIETIGSLPADGVFTARIEKTGNQLAFSVDGVTGIRVISIPAFLDDTNTRPFFGNGNTVVKYDDMVVTQQTNQPPVADAGEDQTVECAGPSGAAVTLDGSGSSDPDGDALTYTWREDGDGIAGPTTDATATVTLGLGEHTIELTVDDGNGETDTDEVLITVEDTTPPTLTLESSIAMWPPNHKYETFTIAGMVASISDVCDAALGIADVTIASVSSDEPEDARGGGDGHTVDDIVIAPDGKSVQLRAERQGSGNGRVYTVKLSVTDASGNEATAAYLVTVPKSQNGLAAVDDGPAYTVSGGLPTKPVTTPSAFSLSSAAPNPFNPSTVIAYEVPQAAHVTLTVYNMLGQEVIRLVDGQQAPGRYTVTWHGRNAQGLAVASGIYLYRLTTSAGFSETKRMTLLK